MPEDSYEQYSLTDDAQPADYLDARYDKDRRSFPADREVLGFSGGRHEVGGRQVRRSASCIRSRSASRRRDRNAAARSWRPAPMPRAFWR